MTAGPVRRLDAAALTAAVNETSELGLTFLGPARGGNVGAGYVTDREGRRGVLTWQPGTPAARHRQVAELVEVARTRGVPAPRYQHVLQVGDDVAVVQELLPGAAPDDLSPDLVHQLIELNRRLRGALTDRPGVPAAELHLTSSGPGFCLHETLLIHSRRTRRLLDQVREVGAVTPPAMAGHDLVHLDYQPANVLVDGAGRVSGVVDWDGTARGDGDLDLVTLCFGLHTAAASPTAADQLEHLLRTGVEPDRLRAYWAHMSLRLVDWAIRHHGPEDVDRWLALAARGLG
ncbi:phosphotransferase [Auraticoccus sp. F435]|uniref:Phosphotransferase n=1 Tax=Auraticoccus cholistanensis TaxID=2656650 RepID=A0A6A9UTR5_9ACTN|nr:phosphotransferase [Auraticoccus cholistanensis]MVA75052.1 phosphotransferase [Auraticoccus cholistanensis]